VSMSTKETVVHLTVEDLAGRFRMPRWSVYELVKEGMLPHFRLGRRVRFRLTDIEEWEKANLRGGVEKTAMIEKES
jgi:excisionase family DNA binding protein